MKKNELLLSSAAMVCLLNLRLGGLSVGMLPHAAVLTAFLIALTELLTHTGGLKPALSKLASFFRGGKAVYTLLLCYVVLDVWGAVRILSSAHFLAKYLAAAEFLIAFLTLLVCFEFSSAQKALFSGGALSGIILCLAAVINTLVFSFQPVEYVRRLSLRSDYNMFASALLCAFICAVMCSVSKKRANTRLIFFSCSMIPVLFLACSRRVWLVMFPTLLLTAAFFVKRAEITRGKSGKTSALFGVFAASVLTMAATLSLNSSLERAYSSDGASGRAEGQHTASAAERLETIPTGGMLTKRLVLWRAAEEDYLTFSPVEKLIGRGTFYDISLYDRGDLNHVLESIYPDRAARLGALSAHSCLLADLLNGGIIKLAVLLLLLLSILKRCLSLLLKTPETGVAVTLILSLTVINNLISNRYGLLYDRWFWLSLPLLFERGGITNG